MSSRASASATSLRGRWLVIARAAWVVIATLALLLFVASTSGYISNVLNLSQADWIGARVEAPAGLVFVVELLGVLVSITSALVCLTLASVLFWRKSDDWMVMFISSYRDETHLDALSDALVGIIRETMRPAHVLLWLRPDRDPKERGDEKPSAPASQA